MSKCLVFSGLLSGIPALCTSLTFLLTLSSVSSTGIAQTRPDENSDSGTARHAGLTSVPLHGGVSRLDSNSTDPETHTLNTHTLKTHTLIPTAPVMQDAKARDVSPGEFRSWLEKSHPVFARSSMNIAVDQVLVIKGEWDNSAKTLDKFRIPYSKVSASDIAKMNLSNARVVIVDCSGRMNRAACQKLRDFVARGGYVLSTDWALDNFLAPTFNEYVYWNKGINKRKIYDATVSDADPHLFAHSVTNAHWKLDMDTHLVGVSNKDAVRVLVRSSMLASEDPDGAGILAVMFPFGRGYVLHMTGHFDNNSGIFGGNKLPDPAPVIGISLRQALAANFIVSGLERRKLPTRYSR